jgi:phospholipase C
MAKTDRRTFLRRRHRRRYSLRCPPGSAARSQFPRIRTGMIADVEHIVILTQENRSFDHLCLPVISFSLEY